MSLREQANGKPLLATNLEWNLEYIVPSHFRSLSSSWSKKYGFCLHVFALLASR